MSLLSILILSLRVAPDSARGQEDVFRKSFKQFKGIAPGVDFYSADRSDVEPFAKPLVEAQRKLAELLGKDLARGVVVLCATMEQKDSVNEARLLKMGYSWALIQLTPEAASQQMLAQVRAQMGGQLPPGMLERIQSQASEMKGTAQNRLVTSTVQRFAAAVLMMTLAPDKPFRSSRLDDVGRSPLADWLDVGLSAFAADAQNSNLKFLQDRLDEAFPLEDVLSMSRPFVAPSAGGPGATGMIIRVGPGGAPGGGAAPSAPPGTPGAGSTGSRVGRMTLPKDVQDRMTFDAQAASFFSYLVQKTGLERVKEMVRWNLTGKDTRDFLAQFEELGSDLDKIEKDWHSWLKQIPSESPGIRIMESAPRRETPPH